MDGEGADVIGAEARREWKAESSRELRRQAVRRRQRFDGWKIGVEDKKWRQDSRRSGRMQRGNGVRDSGRERAVWRW
jgi:hypothetical protein